MVWDRASTDVREAMPCGGGVGLVVWFEDEELLSYMERSGSFDEHNHGADLPSSSRRSPYCSVPKSRSSLTQGSNTPSGEQFDPLVEMAELWIVRC